jgi:hypothetical protein
MHDRNPPTNSTFTHGKSVASPLWAKWENATPTPKSGRLGVLRDSQKLKRRFEGTNLLALVRFLYQ